MDYELLEMFCGGRNDTPSSDENYTYATNGHIIVRVPVLEDKEFAPPRFSPERLNWNHDAVTDWRKLPELSSEARPLCHTCNGKKTVNTCPECGGEGEVTVSSGYNDYECECQTCSGVGHVSGEGKVCTHCFGTGFGDLNVPVGVNLVASRYLGLMSKLPNCLIDFSSNKHEIVLFKFDGGVGCVMPMMEGKS